MDKQCMKKACIGVVVCICGGVLVVILMTSLSGSGSSAQGSDTSGDLDKFFITGSGCNIFTGKGCNPLARPGYMDNPWNPQVGLKKIYDYKYANSHISRCKNLMSKNDCLDVVTTCVWCAGNSGGTFGFAQCRPFQDWKSSLECGEPYCTKGGQKETSCKTAKPKPFFSKSRHTSTTLTEVTKTFQTSDDVAKSSSQDFGLSAGGGMEGFSLGASMQAKNELKIDVKSNSFSSTIVSYKRVTSWIYSMNQAAASLNGEYESQMTRACSTGGLSSAWYQLFDRFGTHYVSSFVTGALCRGKTVVTASNSQELNSKTNNIKAGMTAGFAGMFSGKLSFQQGYRSRSQKDSGRSMSEFQFVAYGGDPSMAAGACSPNAKHQDIENWFQSVPKKQWDVPLITTLLPLPVQGGCQDRMKKALGLYLASCSFWRGEFLGHCMGGLFCPVKEGCALKQNCQCT